MHRSPSDGVAAFLVDQEAEAGSYGDSASHVVAARDDALRAEEVVFCFTAQGKNNSADPVLKPLAAGRAPQLLICVEKKGGRVPVLLPRLRF